MFGGYYRNSLQVAQAVLRPSCGSIQTDREHYGARCVYGRRHHAQAAGMVTFCSPLTEPNGEAQALQQAPYGLVTTIVRTRIHGSGLLGRYSWARFSGARFGEEAPGPRSSPCVRKPELYHNTTID